ncbi:hypothetical protein FRC00_002903 [Tulasnella sp. 408]|nr:hypothetical protein FRC00_002903 [Tulasnella sp. 408]
MQRHNGVIDIQIVNNNIVVAQNCNFNLYNMSEVAQTLLGGGDSAGISAIKAYRCIDYPNLESPVYQGSLLRQLNPRLEIDPGAFALFSMTHRDFYGIISQFGWSSEAASAGTPSEVRCLRDLAQVPGNPFHIVLGPSGRRVAVLSDTHLSIYFTSKPDTEKASGSRDLGGLTACWMIPGDLADIPVTLEFDETTGRCVAAMASGRVWVKEAANFLSETRISSRGTKKIDFDVTEIPNPDPARLPVVLPFPGVQSSPDPPKQVAPRWSNEVDKYFPYQNRSDCYGSTPWLVHEVLHIPVVRPGHQSTSDGKYGARTVLFTVDQARNELCYDEVIEVRPLPGSDEGNRFWLLIMCYGDWEFYKLKPVGSLDDIVAHLQHCGIGALQEHDGPWPADDGKLDQLSRWMDRYNREFGKFERDNSIYQ